MEREHTHTLRTRSGHWINAALVAFLVWSGFSMFAGDRHFAWFSRLLPATFWHVWHFAGTKRELLTWHVYAGTFFGINGIAYIASLFVTGAWRRIMPSGGQWSYDPLKPLRYSIPQRLAYTTVLCGGVVMVLTGSALWFKRQIPWLLASMGGERVVLPIHVIVATSLFAFVALHLFQVLRAGLPALGSMTIGGAMSKELVPVRLPAETPL